MLMTSSTRFVLAPYVRAGFQKKVLYFGFGTIQKQIHDVNLQRCLIEIAHLWKAPASTKEILQNAEKSDFHPDLVRESINILQTGSFLIQEDQYDNRNRYSRHGLFYHLNGARAKEVQSRLKKSRIIILGCGGIGNQMAAALATSGVGELILVDHDKIELSNLSRQILFTEKDVDSLKTQVLSRELKRRDSSVRINAIELKIEKYEDLQQLPDADLIILSADLPAAVSWVNQLSIERRKPFLNVGYVNDVAVWGPFVKPGVSACWNCQTLIARDSVDDSIQMKIERINQNFQSPSFGAINMLASSHAILDVLKYLGKFGQIESENRRMGIWTSPLRIESQTCERNPNCFTCGHI